MLKQLRNAQQQRHIENTSLIYYQIILIIALMPSTTGRTLMCM